MARRMMPPGLTGRQPTVPSGPGPVRSITRGEAESSHKRTESKDTRARKRQPDHQEARPRANRVFVLDAHGKPLMPCTPRRARRLINAGRVGKRFYRPFTIQLKDRSIDDGITATQPVEVRTTPGVRRTGIAIVTLLKNEERTVYQEEIQHRSDISTRLKERKNHRGRRRGERWYRAPRFNNRRPGSRPAAAVARERRLQPGAPDRPPRSTERRRQRGPPGQQVRHPEGAQPRDPWPGVPAGAALQEPPAGVRRRAVEAPMRLLRQGRLERPHSLRARPRRPAKPQRAHQHRQHRLGLPPVQRGKKRQRPRDVPRKEPGPLEGGADQRRPAAASRGRWEYGLDLPNAARAAQHPGTQDQKDDRSGHRPPAERTRDHEEPRQRRGLLRKQTPGHATATTCGPQSRWARAAQADQEPAGRQVPGVETPATGRTTEDAVSRTRTAPEHRVRRRVRRPGAHTQGQRMGERQSASHSRGETRCRQGRSSGPSAQAETTTCD